MCVAVSPCVSFAVLKVILVKLTEEKDSIQCLLCESKNNRFFFRDKFRAYRRCNVCSIIFVPKRFHVSKQVEKARYEEHDNDPNNAGYRQFLQRIAEPIKARFAKGASGLDFGSGPTPLLAEILEAAGFQMEIYDLFYQTNRSVFERRYDFIVSTEVFEHLREPLRELENLFAMLKQNGVLAVMTQVYNDLTDFSDWHYKNDRTHICFYSVETFGWLSKYFGVSYAQIEDDIFIFKAK